jgi:hypothetical protein
MKIYLLAEGFVRNWIKYIISPTTESGRRRWVYEQVTLAALSMLSFANKHNLHGERRAFSSVSQLPLEVFSWKFMSHFPRIHYTHCTFCSHRPIINGTLFSEHGNYSSVFRLPLEGFSWNVIPRLCYEHWSLVALGRKVQYVTSFVSVGGVAGVGDRAYRSLWNDEGWVLFVWNFNLIRSAVLTATERRQ